MTYVAKPPIDRFWERTNTQGPEHPTLGRCWDWTAGTSIGRGVFRINGKHVKAYRFAYEQFVRPIPDGLTIDHLCRRPICVNPQHLEPVPGVTNTMRGESPAAGNARKTHCKRGHPFSGDNLIWRNDGARQCRACSNSRALAAYHRSGKTTREARRKPS